MTCGKHVRLCAGVDADDAANLCCYVLPHDMCGQVLEWTQTMLEAGEAFCGSQSATLRDALKRQSGRFFAAYHSANLQVHSPGQQCRPCSSCFLPVFGACYHRRITHAFVHVLFDHFQTCPSVDFCLHLPHCSCYFHRWDLQSVDLQKCVSLLEAWWGCWDCNPCSWKAKVITKQMWLSSLSSDLQRFPSAGLLQQTIWKCTFYTKISCEDRLVFVCAVL